MSQVKDRALFALTAQKRQPHCLVFMFMGIDGIVYTGAVCVDNELYLGECCFLEQCADILVPEGVIGYSVMPVSGLVNVIHIVQNMDMFTIRAVFLRRKKYEQKQRAIRARYTAPEAASASVPE